MPQRLRRVISFEAHAVDGRAARARHARHACGVEAVVAGDPFREDGLADFEGSRFSGGGGGGAAVGGGGGAV